MRPIGSHNENERAASLGKNASMALTKLARAAGCPVIPVMGVNIETSRVILLPSAVNVGCWSHRKGQYRFDKDLPTLRLTAE